MCAGSPPEDATGPARGNRYGTVSRAVIDVLKAATEPLTIRDIAERMLIARGNTKPDPKDVRKLETGFGPA